MNSSGTTTGSMLSRANLLLVVLGCASLAFYLFGLQAQTANDIVWFLKLALVQIAFYLPATWLVLKAKPRRSTLFIVVIFAVLFRLSILFSAPYLSDDIYRYIWDGRVQAAGINPYRYIPADPALVHLRDDKIYPRINRRDYAHTIYPPFAQASYFLTTRLSESVTWMKATMVLFEAIGLWAIAQLLASFGLSRQRILLYAWHPLTVWEFAGSGHLDAIVIAFVSLALLARRRNADIATGFALALATLTKLFPFVLLPTLYRRGGWKMPVAFAIAIVIAYLPYLGVGPLRVFGFLPGFVAERGMLNGEQFFILSAARRLAAGLHIPTAAFIGFAILILAALIIWMLRKQRQEAENYVANVLILASAFTVLLSPHFPWYFAWLVPFLCFVPSVPILYLTLSSFLLYLTWIDDTDERVFRLKALIFVPFFFLLALTLWLRRLGFDTSLSKSESGAVLKP